MIMKIFGVIWSLGMLFLVNKIGYTIGHRDGYKEHSNFVEKLVWITDCQYKGEKIRNKAECEILYLEKIKMDK